MLRERVVETLRNGEARPLRAAVVHGAAGMLVGPGAVAGGGITMSPELLERRLNEWLGGQPPGTEVVALLPLSPLVVVVLYRPTAEAAAQEAAVAKTAGLPVN